MTTQRNDLTPVGMYSSDEQPKDLGGLLGITGDGERAFPLREVKVRAGIVGVCCRTVVEQRFGNPYEVAMEAVHIFPLPEDGAVTEMELRAGDMVVRAECRERGEAEQIFQQARQKGHRAALLTQERADVHTLRVTNVPPKTDVTVRMVIVEQLDSADGRISWRFPTVIAPRYTPGVVIGHDGDGVVPDTDQAPDASRLQPPLRLAGGTRLDLEVEIAGPLAMLESSLHAVRAQFGEKIRVAPSDNPTLNKDFVLRFSYGQPEQATARAYTDGKYTLVVVNPPTNVVKESLPRDVVLVVDRSGSMGGDKMDAAKRALSAVLHGLNSGDRFRLISFDDKLDVFRPDFVEYTDTSLAQADYWIEKLAARGGTEMMPALQNALATSPLHRQQSRTVIFITDGQVGNDAELLKMVAQSKGDARLFAVGIDTAVNGAFLKQLARIGSGTCELLTPNDNIEEAIARIEARFGEPLATEMSVSPGTVAGYNRETLFEGRTVSFMMEGSPAAIEVRGKTASGNLQFSAVPVATDVLLGPLWARRCIAHLEELLIGEPVREGELRRQITQVSLQHSIASRYTAFVAVEQTQTVDGERVTVVQPVELPDTWSWEFLKMSRNLVVRYQPIRRDSALDYEVLSDIESDGDVAYDFDSDADIGRGRSMRRICACEGMPEPDVASKLAREQKFNGSFGNDAGRTATAVIILLLLGHTRQTGSRRRVVKKALKWLMKQDSNALASLVISLVERVESGGPPPTREEADGFCTFVPEGVTLKILIIEKYPVKST